MVEKKQWKGPEFSNGIRNQGLRWQLHLRSNEMFYEALGQTTGLEIMKHTVKSSMMI
jgi:hypothetical protein